MSVPQRINRLVMTCHSASKSRIAAILLIGCLARLLPAAPAEEARLRFTVLDAKTRLPFPARIHLKDAQGKPVRPDKLPFHRGHFVCPGWTDLKLAPGDYTYEVEHGPEYSMAAGSFTAGSGADKDIVVELKRFVDLAAEGWWSGDLHVHRPLEDIELLMRADDLHVAPVITWWNKKNLWQDQPSPARPLVRFDRDRFYHVLGGEDEREGGALLYFQLRQPLSITDATREHPSPMKFLTEARQQRGVWVDIEKPFWWDVPVWLASGQVDSIGLANNHMCRDEMLGTEAWGKPRNADRLPAPRGNGFWSQEIYYHILNCGLRLPPSAGSASGVLPNPVGYDRVYVQAGRTLNYDRWWEGLRAGRSFVSNGPLLRCRAGGQWPGHVFTAAAGKELKIELRAQIDTRDPISRIEIIKNGRVDCAIPYAHWKQTGTLATLFFNESGWFLVRAITDNEKTFRFASTAPWYVEMGEPRRRVSRGSAQFFLDWVRERMQRVKLTDPAQREEVLQHHRMAEQFWQEKVAAANAE